MGTEWLQIWKMFQETPPEIWFCTFWWYPLKPEVKFWKFFLGFLVCAKSKLLVLHCRIYSISWNCGEWTFWKRECQTTGSCKVGWFQRWATRKQNLLSNIIFIVYRANKLKILSDITRYNTAMHEDLSDYLIQISRCSLTALISSKITKFLHKWPWLHQFGPLKITMPAIQEHRKLLAHQ